MGAGAVTILRKKELFSFVNAAAGLFSAWIETQEQASVAGLVAQVQVCVCVRVQTCRCVLITCVCIHIHVHVCVCVCVCVCV